MCMERVTACLQVLLIPSNPKEKDQVRSLTQRWLKFSQELEAAKKVSELTEEMERTSITSVPLLQHLQQQVDITQKRLLATSRNHILEAWRIHESLAKPLSELSSPTPKKEEAYRLVVVECVSELAAGSKQIESALEEIKAMQEDLKALAQVSFQKEAGAATVVAADSCIFKNAGDTEDGFYQPCTLTALLAKTHVSLCASLVLLRSKSLGAASKTGAELMSKLSGVVSALQKHLEELKPVAQPKMPGFHVRAFGEVICAEAQQAMEQGKQTMEAGKQEQTEKRKQPAGSGPSQSAPAKGSKRKGQDASEAEAEMAAPDNKKAAAEKKKPKKK